MGYNIGDTTAGSTGGPDAWTFEIDLTDPSATTVSGDFDVVSLVSGASLGEAGNYAFSALNTGAYGSVITNSTDGTFTFTVDRAAVIASGSDQVVSFTITGTSGANSDVDDVIINILICVLRGTLVETETGPLPVECLRVGDRVLTRDHGVQPVRWIGSRKLSMAELTADPSLLPVRISAGALGDGLPFRDLGVSPQHRVLLSGWQAELMFGEDEVLVPAKALIEGVTVQTDACDGPVEYFHLLFDAHEVIYTEGAATESFHPGDYALRELGDAAKVELHKLFPELFEADDAPVFSVARPALRPWEGRLLQGSADGWREAS